LFDIVGIESPCVDLLLNSDAYPIRGGSIELNSYGWQGGGKVSTGMIAAARLGAKAAAMGKVGDDSLGRFCIDDFKRHGIDCENLLIQPNKTTTLSVVLSDRESRSFLVKHGTWLDKSRRIKSIAHLQYKISLYLKTD
jgi:sulfofructose kinase